MQGYEPYCLFDLINLYAEEEENIIVNSTLMPKFFYNFKDIIIFDDLLKENKFKDMNYNLLKCYLII